MKRLSFSLLVLALVLSLFGCGNAPEQAQIAATTLPVYEFTSRLCQGTGLTVTRLVTENVSCLHDYSLNVRQVRAAEAAELIVVSGAGLEAFMEDILLGRDCIDASAGIPLLEGAPAHDHGHEEEVHEGHHHEQDPHLWLSPERAKRMARNICSGLSSRYPDHADHLEANLEALLSDLETLQAYGKSQLSALSCRELITFHDGFSYLAEEFDLTILQAVEEESGSEAAASELIELIEEVRYHKLSGIFTETNGSNSAASIIARETAAEIFTLDMAMAGDSYFDAMYRNFDTLKEALE